MLKVYDDSPIQKGSEDQYGRIKLVDKLANIINEKAKAPHSSFTIGIYGAWGEGKTSVLNLLKEQLNEQSNIQLSCFNPWILSSQESIVQDFFLSMNNDFPADLTRMIKRYGGAVAYAMNGIGYALQFSPIPILPLFLQSAAKQLDKIRTILPEREPLSKQKEVINAKLKKSNKHLVVFVDDLDRLDKEEVHMVFRLIRQVADFDNVIYIVAMDHDIVTRSLNAYYEDGENINAGQAFLEKIIQIPILLPRIQPHILHQYANNELLDVLGDQNLVKDILAYLCELYTTKREWNRYLNQLSVVIEFGNKELNMFDVCLIEAIKVFDPKLYSMIGQSKIALCSKLEIGVEQCNPFAEKEYTDIREDILNFVVPNKKNAVGSIIKQLFPQSIINIKEKHTSKRICSKHYFDKYFVLDVLNDYISDEQIEILRDSYRNLSDEQIVNSINTLLDTYSYSEVNRALNMVVVRSQEEYKEGLAVKIMRVMPLCKENLRYGYRYFPMSDYYAMSLINDWIPDYLLSIEVPEIRFDNDAMENLWNYWCTYAPLPYCMELISNFNDKALRGLERERLATGFDTLWKRLSDDQFEFARFSIGYQITYIEGWRSVNANVLRDYILPTLMADTFDLRKYLIKNGYYQQEYRSFLSVIVDIVVPLSERVQRDYADTYKEEKALLELVHYAS